MSEPFYTKYRPQNWNEVIGQEVTIEALQAALDKGHTHAFLVTGPMGCGKTTIGRLIAKTVGCDMSWGFTEINAGNDRGIDTIRNINEKCHGAPLHGKASVYLIDEAHRLTKDAAEALLKTTEDCPAHVFFVLSTSEPGKVIGTLKQRCTHFPIGYLKSYDIMKVLNHVVHEEDLDIPREVLKRIVDLSEGSPRAALVLLEQVEVLKEEDKMLQLLDLFYGNEEKVATFCKLLLEKNWKEAKKALAALEEDAEGIRKGVLGYMAKVIQNSNDLGKANQAANVFMDFSQHQHLGRPGLIWAAYMSCLSE